MGEIEILEQLHHLPPFNVVGWVMENDSINMCMQSEMYSLHIIKKLISFYIHTRPTRVHHPSRTLLQYGKTVAVKTCKHLNWLHHHHQPHSGQGNHWKVRSCGPDKKWYNIITYANKHEFHRTCELFICVEYLAIPGWWWWMANCCFTFF